MLLIVDWQVMETAHAGPVDAKIVRLWVYARDIEFWHHETFFALRLDNAVDLVEGECALFRIKLVNDTVELRRKEILIFVK